MPIDDAGTTTQTTGATTSNKPGKRPKNPLGNFSSSTYQITLYMVSPDAYNNFAASGRKSLTTSAAGAGTATTAVIVAQSGGVNNTANKRADGFNLDYYIDDLKIKALINPKTTGTATIASEITFVITEPYGFSFITNLKKAADSLKASSTIKNYSKLENASKQFYILGIRFQGYDATGKVVTASDMFASDTINPGSQGVFERFYDIFISEMKFKIDGKASVYNIKAVSIPPQTSGGMKRGRVNNGSRVVANYVWEAIGGEDFRNDGVIGLLDTLNDAQQILATKPVKLEGIEGPPAIEIANVYKIRWLGDAEDLIGLSTILSPADMAKSKYPMARTNNTIESNMATETTSTPDPTKRTLTFKNDTAIAQAINTIISQSSYLEDALAVVASGDTLDEDELENGGKNKVRWYNLSSEVVVLGWDTKTNDFAYEITYVIQTYDIPAAISVYGNSPTEYYGPHKRYDYWYTGQNSEILKYEQTLDNLYYLVVLGGTSKITTNADGATSVENSDPSQTAISPNAQVNGNPQGKPSEGMSAQNSVVANLYDPGSYASVKIQILGDPDFLMQDAPDPVGALYDPYYGHDNTIRPNAGQVFIEIDFKEAKDYNNSTGLLDINSSILFWKYPPALAAKVHGVSYMITGVNSTFSKGAFTQELSGVINTFPGWKDPATAAAATTANSTNTAASNTTSAGSGIVNLGTATGNDLDLAG